jgi:hypothetical protein
MVLRPNEDDKRQNYDASTTPKGAPGLGERSLQGEANLSSRNGFQLNPQSFSEVISISSRLSFDVERKRRVARRICRRRNSAYRGSGSFMLARAYPMTAIAAAFSRSSLGTILSSVSAAVWW